MRTLILLATALLAAIPESAAVLPGTIGAWKQTAVAPLDVQTDRPLWDEYGLQTAEEGRYERNGQALTVDTWRLADSTSSMAAFEFLRPATGRPIPTFETLTPNTSLIPNGALVALGNYLVRFQGGTPTLDEAANLFRSMAHYERSTLPTFGSYLPGRQTPNSERYVGGPVALQRFFPDVPPSVVGFRFGAEAAVADYGSGGKMALFSYPTPGIARDREAALAKVPGLLLKRTGPLVAVIAHSSDPNLAENLLSQVRYQATITTGQPGPTKRDNPGNLLLNVFYLILILAGFCLMSGVLFGVGRMVFRRSGADGEGEEILALHLGGR